MPSLSPGTVITVSDGSSLTVIAYIASGGQGEVYRVRRNPGGREMALKWYTNRAIIDNPDFLKTLRHNCRHKAPSDAFLWPEAVTDRQYGSFGYIMRLRPEGFVDLGKFFCIDRNPQAYFRSWLAKLTACIQICDAFSRLHNNGFSYQDINDGSFLIDPFRGHVLICDNDNIVSDGCSNGVSGKPHYMAPEVAEGNTPDRASDRFSLAIILYRILMIDHPFEGRSTTSYENRCLTPDREMLLFGREAVFCHDTADCSNAPVEGLHDNSILYWRYLTSRLQRAFRIALCCRAIVDPCCRIRASSWKQMMLAERAALVTCHAAPDVPVHDYLCEGAKPDLCPLCGSVTGAEVWLDFGDAMPAYRLTASKPLFLGESFVPEGICRAVNSSGVDSLVLENVSRHTWHIVESGGRRFKVVPGAYCRLVGGASINFGSWRAKIEI